ncbi:MAG: hypothetical protein Q7V13_08525 [Phenylobacterium sp.]|uniref:hypothetical protein n=1 Tax=Phenylobacterium sp. TaxID=1871053 RepID=UPI002723933E|nr:hypothetical protein [Phenylobacterium sp.]MDO8911878.1 hypothetical protein [Phenylobacterium sp.]MDZ4059635.1 hypothetical protein [Brevundimonas sp.]
MLKLLAVWLAVLALSGFLMAREPRERLVSGPSFWTTVFCWSLVIGLIFIGFSILDLFGLVGGGGDCDYSRNGRVC